MLTMVFVFCACEKGDSNPQDNTSNTHNGDNGSEAANTCKHTWCQWTEIVKPTCNQVGKQTRKCVNCLKNESRSLKKLSHKNSDWIIDRAATVEEEGYKHTECIYCNKKIKEQSIAKIKADHVHSGVEWLTTKIPDCTTTGSENYVCSCGATIKTQAIPANGHTTVVDKGVSATCTSNGLTEGSSCSICNTIIKKQTVVKATGHKMASKTIAATSTEAGYVLHYCTTCSYSYKEQLPTEEVIYDSNGIEYTRDENGDFWVSGIGTCTLSNIVIPNNVNDKAVVGIRPYSLSGNTKIKSVTFSNGITVIGQMAFAHCKNIKAVSFPSTLKRIEDQSFYNCRFESVVLPDGLEYIGVRAFEVDGGKLVIPDSVKTIGNYAFSTSGIEEVTIPGNVSLGTNVFKDCTSLKKVTIKEGLEKIPKQTFMNCKELNEINLPKSITFYGHQAFLGCSKLRIKHLVAKNLSGEKAFSGVAIDTLEVYSTVSSYMFYNCSIGKLILHEGVTEIGEQAFADSAISSIQLPMSLTTVDSYAFHRCHVNDIAFNSAVSLGHSAFKGSTLKTLKLQNGSKFDLYVFCDCENLQTITFGGTQGEWRSVIRDHGFSPSDYKEINAATVICSDGTIEPH